MFASNAVAACFACALLAQAACATSSTTSSPPPTTSAAVASGDAARDERAIAATLDAWHAAAARGDEAAYFDAFSPDGVFLGTDETERWDVPAFRAYAHPHFARGKAWSFHATRRAI